jgi:hypothetical protein
MILKSILKKLSGVLPYKLAFFTACIMFLVLVVDFRSVSASTVVGSLNLKSPSLMMADRPNYVGED